ncbi:MAG: DUF2802 domain-containing protein [Azoarcus sp.]|jgi:hypothetical protein|nr:DUF2802 domain-containing protein [Azoarcus sp.]
MRQLIFLLIALLLVYGGWQFLCALRTGFRRQAIPLTAKKTGTANLDDDLFNYDAHASAKDSNSGMTVAVYSHNEPGISVSEKVEEIPLDSFAIELELQRLRLEISTLREMAEAQQKEIESLRADVKCSATSKIEAAIPFTGQDLDMSPEYDEALALARRGIVADVIASRCGITRAEADLVASLAERGQQREAAGGAVS